MLFLITGKSNLSADMDREQAAEVLEHVIIPSLESMAVLIKEHCGAGGVFAAGKGAALVLDVADSDELGELLTSLPFWGFTEWDITPLQSFEKAVAQRSKVARYMKDPALLFEPAIGDKIPAL